MSETAFAPQNELEISLMRAARDPAHRPRFYRDLVAADIFVIEHGASGAAGGRTVQAGERIAIQPFERDGKEYLPFFSSLPRLQAVLRQEASYLSLNALEFFKLTQGADLMLNPGSAYGKELSRSEVASIVDGSIWQPAKPYVMPKDTQVLIGQPARYPTELVEALKRFFKTRREVKRAWLAHIVDPARNEKGHTLIELEVAGGAGDWDRLIAEIGMVAEGITIPDPPIDFHRNHVLRGTKLFYEKKRFSFF